MWKVVPGAQELASAAPTGSHTSSHLPMNSPEKPATTHSTGSVVEENNSKSTPQYSNPEYKRRELNSSYNIKQNKDRNSTAQYNHSPHGESEGDLGTSNALVPPRDSASITLKAPEMKLTMTGQLVQPIDGRLTQA